MRASSGIRDVDVVIVGGGLAGSSMAAALRDSGLQIAVLETVPFDVNQQPSFDDRALALSYGSKCIFQTLGLWQLIEHVVTPIKHIHISDKGHGGFMRLHAEEANVDALGYVVAARELGVALHHHNECSAISIISPAQVDKIDITQSNAELLFSIAGERQQTLHARLVILADGGRSGLAQQLGVQTTRHDYQQQAILANVQCDQAHHNIAYERFTVNGPVALLPIRTLTSNNDQSLMAEHAYKLVCTVPKEQQHEMMALSDDGFLDFIQQWFGDRAGKFIAIGKRVTYPMTESSVDNIAMQRLALIGNAAHAMHPIAGQGFNLGLRDVAVLAELITEAAHKQQDIGGQQLLNTYKQQRLDDIQSMSGLTGSLVRFFSNATMPMSLLRNIGLLVMDRTPFVKKQLMRKMMGLSGKQSKLMRGMSLVGHKPVVDELTNNKQSKNKDLVC